MGQIQLQVFPSECGGGYVLHKIPATALSTCSAWFDSAGILQDAVYHLLGTGRATPVQPGSNRWTTLQRIGRRYAGVAAKRVAAEQKKARG